MSKDIRGRGTQILLVTGRPLWFSGYWIPECAHLHGWMDVCVSVWECATIEVDHVTIRHLCPFCLSWRRWNNSVTFRQIWTDWPDRAKLSGADLQTCLIDLRLPVSRVYSLLLVWSCHSLHLETGTLVFFMWPVEASSSSLCPLEKTVKPGDEESNDVLVSQ